VSGRRGRCTDIPCSGCYGGKQCRCTPNFPAPCDGRYGSEACAQSFIGLNEKLGTMDDRGTKQ